MTTPANTNVAKTPGREKDKKDKKNKKTKRKRNSEG
jgi:hypothetical protein